MNSSPLQDIPMFPLIISVPSSCELKALQALQSALVGAHELDRIHLSDQLTLPEFNCSLLYLYGKSTAAKLDACREILKFLNEPTERPALSVSILVPPSTLTTLVGKNGTSLQRVQATSSTVITIKDEVQLLNEREVQIEGKLFNVLRAVEIVYRQIVEKLQFKEPKAPALEVSDKAKFVIPGECVGLLIGKNGVFTKMLRSEYDVDLRVDIFEETPCQENDHVIVLVT